MVMPPGYSFLFSISLGMVVPPGYSFLFKTSRGIAFRHPFGISFQDLSRHRIQTSVWHFFSRPLEASHSDTRLAFFLNPRAVQRPMFHFIFLESSGGPTPMFHFIFLESSGGPRPDVSFYFLGILGRSNA